MKKSNNTYVYIAIFIIVLILVIWVGFSLTKNNKNKNKNKTDNEIEDIDENTVTRKKVNNLPSNIKAEVVRNEEGQEELVVNGETIGALGNNAKISATRIFGNWVVFVEDNGFYILHLYNSVTKESTEFSSIEYQGMNIRNYVASDEKIEFEAARYNGNKLFLDDEQSINYCDASLLSQSGIVDSDTVSAKYILTFEDNDFDVKIIVVSKKSLSDIKSNC